MNPRPILAAALALGALAPAAAAQSINVDFEQVAGSVNPQVAFGGAAASPGIWNSILAAQGLYGGLSTTAGAFTPATIALSTGVSGRCSGNCVGATPAGSDNEALMDDYLRFNGNLTVTIRNLDAGRYDVYVYGWAPDDVNARTDVYNKSLGGAWPANEMQLLDRTYARKLNVPVAAGNALKIKLTVSHSFGTLNGLQLVQTSSTVGSSYCPAMPNSTGEPARMLAFGSTFALENFLFVSCANMPENSFCVFITSQTTAMVPASGQGYLCVGGAVARGVGGQIFNSGQDGFVTTAVDLTAHPTPTGPVSVMPGETWYIQCWMRDLLGGVPTSITSDGVALTFQ